MLDVLDINLAATLAGIARQFALIGRGAAGGVSFENEVYRQIRTLYGWEHVGGPNHFNMELPIVSQTGTAYEFDGVFASRDSLYLIEAKHRHISRELVSIFVQKVLDISLGAHEDISHLRIKPIMVSTLQVDEAAWYYAASWGILLINPTKMTPFEIVYTIKEQNYHSAASDNLVQECEALGRALWRPFNSILHSQNGNADVFDLYAHAILRRGQVTQLFDHWQECLAAARDLNIGGQ